MNIPFETYCFDRFVRETKTPPGVSIHRTIIKRLARMLLLLANFGKEEKPEPILAKISLETLAEMIGTTRSRVSFFMNKFRKLGLIDYNGCIEVRSSLLNVVLHDEPHINT
jgi:CRP/FNR family transcriptional regulator, cyclic AMP receptor protein